ncbi:hypothetical protein [Alcanivorax sp. DP30]|uniref:hypothetical protein n=1 Tax=Alcanivorax sp. DP30 TaxID=2606217 RepID=UPI0013694A4B|nr:hypothetical protein [Alcanivorax sp. DP30]MZR62517.1 hypothetical protein [Alcanivorax sp. DP30]
MLAVLLRGCILLLSGAAQAACLEGSGEVLHARYDVYGQTQRYSVDFYRDPQQVAWQQDAVISVWSRDAGGASLLRAFPHFQRSIWYPAEDLQALGTARAWRSVAGWPEPASLGYAVEVELAGVVQGCPVTEYGRGVSRVLWVEAADLPARISDGEQVWQLVALKKRSAAETFGRWLEWPSTDFTDVGDSEVDPFLRRMIAQGVAGRGAYGAASAEAAP